MLPAKRNGEALATPRVENRIPGAVFFLYQEQKNVFNEQFQKEEIMKANYSFVCLPLVSVLSTAALVAAAPRGDYGDAPDNGPTHYRMMFETSATTGRFPTLYATTNSRFGNQGVHHVLTNQEWFGPMDSPPSRETDANDTTSDDDVYQNLINNDLRDNGLPKIPFFIALTQMPPAAVLSYYVSVPAGAPDVYRYVNVLIDWDQDGQWKQSPVPGALPEWVIQNHLIDLAPGNTALFTSPAFLWGWNALLGPQCFWMRMTLSQVPLNPLSYQDGWDGSGSFPTGETEDYLFHPGIPRDVVGPWVPPGDAQKPHRPRNRPKDGLAPGGAGPKVLPPLPPLGRKRPLPPLAPDLVIQPSDQTVLHGTTALAHVVKIPSTTASPALPDWKVGMGLRNGGFDFGSPSLPTVNGTFYPFGPFAASASWGPPATGAPAGTLNTIAITSALDPRTPDTEDWPLEVSAVFPGGLARTATGIVRVRHSGSLVPGISVESGLPGLYEHGRVTVDGSAIAEPEKSEALTLLNGSRQDFESGLTAAALAKLANLHTMVTPPPGLPGITPEEQTRLMAVINFLETELSAIQAVHGAVPVPTISWPADGADIAGTIELLITSLYPPADIDLVVCETRDPVSGVWVPLVPPPTNPEPGQWLQEINTLALPNGIRDFRVTLTDQRLPGPSDDRKAQAVVALRIDNIPPAAPALLAPAPGQTVGGTLHVEASAMPEDAWVASAEISTDGIQWTEMATDYFAPDGWNFDLDTRELPGGTYLLRVTCSDAAENSTSSAAIPVLVSPSYPSWRQDRGITSDTDDADGDSIPAVLEYYADLNPLASDSPMALQLNVEKNGNDFFLRCRRREFYDGLSVVVEASSDLGVSVPWTPIAVDPPRDPSGRIEVALPPGPQQFGRIRFQP